MLSQLRRIVNKAGPDESFHIIDLCCGKGFLATLVAVMYPQFKVTAVDWLEAPFLPHFNEAGILNCDYAILNVLAPSFSTDVDSLIDEKGGRPAIVLGMHLCGLLSFRAIQLLEDLPRVHGLVLSPCCLPNATMAEGTPSSVYEGKKEVQKYDRWCDHLETRIFQATEERRDRVAADQEVAIRQECTSFSRRREVEAGIVSEKRTVLAAFLDGLGEA